MIKAIKRKRILFPLLASALLCACNNDDNSDADSTASGATTASSPVTTSTPQIASALTGLLDTLWVSADSFMKLPNKKIVFSFAFRKPDTLTLHGWYCRGAICLGSYNDQPYPDIGLTKGRPSTVTYGPNVTFGNIILKNVKKIQDMIGTKYKYVIFVPEKYGDFIKYVIYLGTEDPTLIQVLVVDPTGVEANPSPPKTY